MSNDPNWRGVQQERSVRDLVFAVLFLVVFGLMIGIGILGFSHGRPAFLDNVTDGTIAEEVETYMTQAVAILRQDRNFLVGAMFGAVSLAFLWIQAMKWFTKAFIYIMIALGLSALIALGVYLFMISRGSVSNTNTDLQYLAYIIWGVSLILVIVVFFLRKKIALTAALMKEACRGLQHNPSLFLVSFIVIAMYVAFAAFWVAQFVFLFSVPYTLQITPSGENSDLSSGNPKILFSTSYRNLIWYQIFGGLWTVFVLGAILQHSIAGGYASWYFSQNSPNKPSSPAFKALGWGMSYNFGSLAFGSLIVAIVAFINFLLEKAKQQNQTNKVLQALLSCVQCCLGSIQSIVEWINKFAFIYVAMHGESFCKSAKGVWKLMSRNFFSAVVIDLVSDFVLFFGQILGSCIVTLSTIAIIDSMKDDGYQVHVLTVVLIALGTYLVFSLFASIIGTGVDTVLICYLEDLERNKDGALNMNIELHNMLQERTEKLRSANSNV